MPPSATIICSRRGSRSHRGGLWAPRLVESLVVDPVPAEPGPPSGLRGAETQEVPAAAETAESGRARNAESTEAA